MPLVSGTSADTAVFAYEVEPGKALKITPQANLHLSQVSLGAEAKLDGKRNVLQAQPAGMPKPFAICVLTPVKTDHATVDLVFPPNSEVSFSVHGTSSVFISGYYIQQHEDDDDEFDEEDSEDEDMLMTQLGAARKSGVKVREIEDDSEDDSEAEPKLIGASNAKDMSEDDEDEDDEEEDEDDEDEDDDEDEEPVAAAKGGDKRKGPEKPAAGKVPQGPQAKKPKIDGAAPAAALAKPTTPGTAKGEQKPGQPQQKKDDKSVPLTQPQKQSPGAKQHPDKPGQQTPKQPGPAQQGQKGGDKPAAQTPKQPQGQPQGGQKTPKQPQVGKPVGQPQQHQQQHSGGKKDKKHQSQKQGTPK